MRADKCRGGYTFVELIIVLGIIGVLSSLVMVSSQKIFTRQKIAQAKYELRQLNVAFEMYFADFRDYPPYGSDACSICSNPPNSSWTSIMDNVGTYLSGRLDRDPWGNYWGYDKNFGQPCWRAYSLLCSAGPNGSIETNSCQSAGASAGGDDICIFFVV